MRNNTVNDSKKSDTRSDYQIQMNFLQTPDRPAMDGERTHTFAALIGYNARLFSLRMRFFYL
jgi:hypothetical protein